MGIIKPGKNQHRVCFSFCASFSWRQLLSKKDCSRRLHQSAGNDWCRASSHGPRGNPGTRRRWFGNGAPGSAARGPKEGPLGRTTAAAQTHSIETANQTHRSKVITYLCQNISSFPSYDQVGKGMHEKWLWKGRSKVRGMTGKRSC